VTETSDDFPGLPDQLGGALLHSARAAFADGLRLTAAISVAALGVAAARAVALLHRERTGAERSPDGRRLEARDVLDAELVHVA
jgi:hypothetical protein